MADTRIEVNAIRQLAEEVRTGMHDSCKDLMLEAVAELHRAVIDRDTLANLPTVVDAAIQKAQSRRDLYGPLFDAVRFGRHDLAERIAAKGLEFDQKEARDQLKEFCDQITEVIEQLRKDFVTAVGLDQMRRNVQGIDIFKKVGRVIDRINEKAALIDDPRSAQRLEAVRTDAQGIRYAIGTQFFGLTAADMDNSLLLSGARTARTSTHRIERT